MILTAMSGGVDSAAAAALLLHSGTAGATMLLHPDGGAGVRDAAAVCAALRIPFSELHWQEDFHENVIAPFVRVYQSGGTPNPCVLCNRTMKFGRFLDYALAQGFDGIATGHYARIERSGSRWLLRAGDDPARDQTYFLYSLSQHQLAHTRFPIGSMRKDEVRALVADLGLPVAHKHDSQDICFIPDGDYLGYLRRSGAALTPGRFVTKTDACLGTHPAAEAYTIGQRKGLGLACGHPVYVVRKDGGDVVIGEECDLYTTRVQVRDCNWIAFAQPEAFTAEVALRFTKKRSRARVHPTEDGAVLEFDTPQRAVTAGQAAVFYDGAYVLGGGTIVGSG